MGNRVFAYDDPSPSGGNVRVYMKEDEVIKFMRRVSSDYPTGHFLTDEQLIEEFCITCWAWDTADKRPKKEENCMGDCTGKLGPYLEFPVDEDNTPKKCTKEDNWEHRSQGMKCNTCMWFVEKRSKNLRTFGRCRRHAPTMNGFPAVFGTDWCGDHKLDENKIK